MEIFFLAAGIAGWAVGVVMVAALVSDFRKRGSGGRAWTVLIGAVLLTLGPMVAEALDHGHLPVGDSVFVFTFTFGIAAALMYAIVVIASALVGLYRRFMSRRHIAV